MAKPELFEFRQLPTYRIPEAVIRGMVRALPRQAGDSAAEAEARVAAILETLVGLGSRNAVEAMWAVQLVVNTAAALHMLELANEPGLALEMVRRMHAQANTLQRTAVSMRRELTLLQAEPEPAFDAATLVEGSGYDIPGLAGMARRGAGTSVAPPAARAAPPPRTPLTADELAHRAGTSVAELAAMMQAEAMGEATRAVGAAVVEAGADASGLVLAG